MEEKTHEKKEEESFEMPKCPRCNSKNTYLTVRGNKIRCRKCGFAER